MSHGTCQLHVVVCPGAARSPRIQSLLGIGVVSLGLLLLGAPAANSRLRAGDCPPNPGFSDDLASNLFDFCVYYNKNEQNTSDYAQGILSTQDAQTARSHVENYWDRYVNDFGFLPPSLQMDQTKLTVELELNGGTCWGTGGTGFVVVEPACYLVPESLQKVVGHELFHSMQRNYDSGFQYLNWLGEGTARAIEDSLFTNIDNWPEALAGNVASSFNKEVNGYLSCTNKNLRTYNFGYSSALWWKYFSEQFGTTVGEPQLGIDAFVELMNAAAVADDVAAVNLALSALGAGTDFHTAFRRFTVANVTKDLEGVPDASYFYVDEKQAGNPAPYGPLTVYDGGTVSLNETVSFIDTMLALGEACFLYNLEVEEDVSVSSYGVLYFRVAPGNNCPALKVTFENKDGGPAFYHVVTRNGTQFDRHVEGSGATWVQSFVSGGITDAVAIMGSLENSSLIDVTFACADPDLEIKLPNNQAVSYVGPFNEPGHIIVQVLVTDGSPNGPVVGGFSKDDFTAKVGGIDAQILAGGFVEEQYWLVVAAPSQEADGAYNLQITLKNPGSNMPLGIDVSQNSVVYGPDFTDHVLVIDRSGSMGSSGKLKAAQDAAKFYVDVTRNDDGLAVVAYNQDVNPPPDSMESVDAVVRFTTKSYINLLTASGATSIGDGLAEAVDQINNSPTANDRCSVVLLSDGMENSQQFWADVEAAVVQTGCPVTAIAFGAESDETLMQDIASATGGALFFNDVVVSSDGAGAGGGGSSANVALELANVYEYAQGLGEGRQRLFSETSVMSLDVVEQAHEVLVDDTVSEVVFALDWVEPLADFVLRLVGPDGTLIDASTLPYTFFDDESNHLGWRIASPARGRWTMLVSVPNATFPDIAYQVLASAKTDLTLSLLLPAQLGGGYQTGDSVPIHAIVAGESLDPATRVEAEVTSPDGTRTVLPLLDDGQHADGGAGDGLYGNLFSRVTRAPLVSPEGETAGDPPPPEEEGAYRVLVHAKSDAFQRQARGSFAVTAGEDGNGNGLPDGFEARHQLSDPTADTDLDGLDGFGEFGEGTDPRNSDSDGGGENDGSESARGQDPLDPRDDEIVAPQFFRAEPGDGIVLLQYDVAREYVAFSLYRSDRRDGPWALIADDLPLAGSFRNAVPNGQEFFYRLLAVDREGHRSRVLQSDAVVPSADPAPPLAGVLIDGGAPSTCDREVTLSFIPLEYPELASDIAEVLVANDHRFTTASWQPFAPSLDWDLGRREIGELASIYVLFRDAAGNLSAAATAAIRFRPPECGGPLTIQRGKVNADDTVDISDAIALLGFLFLNEPPELPCRKSADANDDGELDISDPILLLGILFLGAPAPPPFFPDCGPDPTSDALSCDRPAECVTEGAGVGG